MKRIISLFLILSLFFSMVGCGSTEKQDALLKYINEDIVTLAEIESEMIESYNSVTGENYTDDYVTYTELTGNTVVLARKLNDEAIALAATISDDELYEIHKLYINYVNKFLSSVTITISALETQDFQKVAEANEKLTEANTAAIDFNRALNNLAKENNIEMQYE